MHGYIVYVAWIHGIMHLCRGSKPRSDLRRLTCLLFGAPVFGLSEGLSPLGLHRRCCKMTCPVHAFFPDNILKIESVRGILYTIQPLCVCTPVLYTDGEGARHLGSMYIHTINQWSSCLRFSCKIRHIQQSVGAASFFSHQGFTVRTVGTRTSN